MFALLLKCELDCREEYCEQENTIDIRSLANQRRRRSQGQARFGIGQTQAPQLRPTFPVTAALSPLEPIFHNIQPVTYANPVPTFTPHRPYIHSWVLLLTCGL
jgi:hypothetical protein